MVTCKFRPMYSPHLSLGVTGSVGVEVVADRARRSRFAGSRTGLWKDGDQAKGQHGWNKGKQTFRSSDKTNLTNPCGFNSGIITANLEPFTPWKCAHLNIYLGHNEGKR